MILEKYIPAYKIIAIIIFANIFISALSLFFYVPAALTYVVCFISSFIGIFLVSAVIPNTELVAGDEKGKFTSNTIMYSFICGCMNIGISLGLAFGFISLFGGLLLKIGNLYISSSIVSAVGFVIYLVVQWRYLTFSGYQATIKKEYNGPLFAITGALAVSFQIPFMMVDWVVKKPLEIPFPLNGNSVHIFLSILPFMRTVIPATIGVILMVCVNIYIIALFYKKGRDAFFEERPNNKGYDEEQQKEIYRNEKVKADKV